MSIALFLASTSFVLPAAIVRSGDEPTFGGSSTASKFVSSTIPTVPTGTATIEVPVMAPDAAVMVVTPAPVAVTNPVLLTSATVSLDETHVMVAEMALPCWSLGAAANCTVFPGESVRVLGDRIIVVSTAGAVGEESLLPPPPQPISNTRDAAHVSARGRNRSSSPKTTTARRPTATSSDSSIGCLGCGTSPTSSDQECDRVVCRIYGRAARPARLTGHARRQPFDTTAQHFARIIAPTPARTRFQVPRAAFTRGDQRAVHRRRVANYPRTCSRNGWRKRRFRGRHLAPPGAGRRLVGSPAAE